MASKAPPVGAAAGKTPCRGWRHARRLMLVGVGTVASCLWEDAARRLASWRRGRRQAAADEWRLRHQFRPLVRGLEARYFPGMPANPVTVALAGLAGSGLVSRLLATSSAAGLAIAGRSSRPQLRGPDRPAPAGGDVPFLLAPLAVAARQDAAAVARPLPAVVSEAGSGPAAPAPARPAQAMTSGLVNAWDLFEDTWADSPFGPADVGPGGVVGGVPTLPLPGSGGGAGSALSDAGPLATAGFTPLAGTAPAKPPAGANSPAAHTGTPTRPAPPASPPASPATASGLAGTVSATPGAASAVAPPSAGGTAANASQPAGVAPRTFQTPVAVQFSSVSYGTTEPAGSVAIAVVLTKASAQTCSVQYATADNGATAGEDYVSAAGTLVFAPGQTSKNITVTIIDDRVIGEGGEGFTVSLTNPINCVPGSPIKCYVAIGEEPVVSIGSAFSTNEGSPAGVTCVLNQVSGSDVTVQYTTSDGTAVAGTDYVATTGTLTIPAGKLSGGFSIPTLDDNLNGEPLQTFNVTLSNPTNAALGNASCVITIFEDETPTVQFNPGSYSTTEDGTGSVTATAVPSGPAVQTVTVQYASSDGSAKAGTDYTAVSGMLSFPPGQTSESFNVPILDDEKTGEPNTENFSLTLSNPTVATLGYPSTATVSIQEEGFPNPTITGGQVRNEVEQGNFLPFGVATVAPNTGGLRVSQPLDFDQSPGTAVGGDPALDYNSDTAKPRPVIEATVQVPPDNSSQQTVQVQLVWNSVAQGWIKFIAPASSSSQTFVLDLQVSAPVTATGVYPFTIQVQDTNDGPGADDSGPIDSSSGLAQVVVNDGSPFGAGWGLAGVTQLVFDQNGNALLVHGSGDSRLFTAGSGGSFTSPPEDFGTLAQNGTGYRYTDTHQDQWLYDSGGFLTGYVDRHGLTTTYTEQAVQPKNGGPSELLTKVQTPDGGVTQLSYDNNNLLQSITEPGGRVVQLAHNGNGDLATITDADGQPWTLNYDNTGKHELTSEFWGPLSDSYTFSNAQMLTGLDRGTLSYTVNPRAAAALNTAVPPGQAGFGSVTDALNRTSAYAMDLEARKSQETLADGTTESWQRDNNGEVTQYTDPLVRNTYYTYDGSGDVASVSQPDGSGEFYQYDSTFHELTQSTDGSGATTTNYLNSQGDVTETIDPDSNKSYLYYDSKGNQTGSIDGRGLLSQTLYDNDNRVTGSMDPKGGLTRTYYDSGGNVSGTLDADGFLTQTLHDANGQFTGTVDADGYLTKT